MKIVIRPDYQNLDTEKLIFLTEKMQTSCYKSGC